MTWLIDATDDGFELTWSGRSIDELTSGKAAQDSAARRRLVSEPGGHGEVERLYGQAAKVFDKRRPV